MQWSDAIGKQHARCADTPRIVSLVPSLTELLVDLGLAEHLVGRTGFCVHPRHVVRRLPKLGGTKGFAIEKLRALAPTHVLVNIDENRREEVAALHAFVPQVIVTHPLAVRDNLALYQLLGGIFGRDPQVEARARALAADFEREWAALSAQTATLLTLSGQVLGISSGEMGSLLPPVPAPSQLRAARGGRGLAQIGEAPGGGLMVRALATVDGSLGSEPRVLQLTQAVPASIARSAESVAAAHRDYQELQLGRTGLKHIYTLTLTLALLLALFSAVALAFFLAERLARPLLILAEGTQAVAAGDFTPRATVEASDELGVLTHSFNSMTHQLSEARAQADHHRAETEAAQAYLESVLANLSAGVLAFDLRFRLRAANRGAQAILGDDLAGFEQLRLQEWPRHETLAGAILGGFAARGDEWQEQLEIARPDGCLLYTSPSPRD